MDDEINAALAADGTIDITTIGARSGLPRTNGDLVSSLRRPDVHHRHAGPPGLVREHAGERRFTFHLKESVNADLDARAVPVLDDRTRRWVFSQPHAWNDWYREQATFDELVASAPMVEVLFEGDAA